MAFRHLGAALKRVNLGVTCSQINSLTFHRTWQWNIQGEFVKEYVAFMNNHELLKEGGWMATEVALGDEKISLDMHTGEKFEKECPDGDWWFKSCVDEEGNIVDEWHCAYGITRNSDNWKVTGMKGTYRTVLSRHPETLKPITLATTKIAEGESKSSAAHAVGFDRRGRLLKYSFGRYRYHANTDSLKMDNITCHRIETPTYPSTTMTTIFPLSKWTP